MTRRRVSSRALIMMGIGALLFMAGASAQAGWLFVLAAGVLGLIAASFPGGRAAKAVEVELSTPRRARVGDHVRVGMTVAATRRTPLLWIEQRIAAFEPYRVGVEPLAASDRAVIEWAPVPIARGAYTSADLVVHSGAPFGLIHRSWTRRVPVELTVVPRWVELRSFPILEPSSFPSDTLHERARTGAGEEYLGVRDYRAGDSPRWIHWRTSARAGHLVVREWEEEVFSRVALVLTGVDSGTPPESAFEALVSAAASISIYALSTGHPVDLVTANPDGESTVLGDPDRYGLLDSLARARPSDARLGPLVKAALARLGRRGTVVVLTSSAGRTGTDLPAAVRSIQAAGSRAIVVRALSSSWDDKVAGGEADGTGEAAAGRTPVRVVAQGKDLRACLEG